MPRSALRGSRLLAAAGVLALLAGCQRPRTPAVEPRPGELVGLLPAEADARADAVRRDPRGYIERVAGLCRGLEQYTLTFTRYERRGLFQKLYGPERIQCWFRRQPFSVRMKWLADHPRYNEMVYVADRPKAQVRFVTRRWNPPLRPPPQVNRVDVDAAVTFGESKRPLTDFGLERLMQRTRGSLREAGDKVVITYQGLVQLPDGGPTVHHLHLEYDPQAYKVPVQDLYIDVATDLPAGTILKRADGKLDASYFYRDLDPRVRLSDADFLLPAEREQPAKKMPAGRHAG